MKKFLSLMLALALVLSLAACGGSSGSGSSSGSGNSSNGSGDSGSDEGYVIGFSNMLSSDIWFQQLQLEVEQVLEDYKEQGIVSEYYITNADGDVMKQQADIRDLITQGCDAIVVLPISYDGLNNVLQEAGDAGIPVIAVGQDCGYEDKLGCIVTDDEAIGVEVGTFIGNIIPEGGKILEIAGIAGAETAEKRKVTAEKAFYEANPTAEILAVEYCGNDYAATKVAMESLLVTYPDFDAIMCLGGTQGMACIDSMQEHGVDLVPVTDMATNGFLALWKELDATMEGGYASMGSVSPSRQAATGVKVMVEYLQTGELPEELTDDGVMYDWVDAVTLDTLDQYYDERVIDSFYIVGQGLDEDTVLEKFSK